MSRQLTKRFSVEEVLAQVSGHDEEGTEIEPEIEEDVSEVKDNTLFDPDFEETEQAPEEQAPEKTFQSKSGHLFWSSSPQDRKSRARMENITKMTPGPTRNIWDGWVERLPLMYNPGPEVTADERLVPFRGRCSFKMYIPSKPGECGIKIWAACDARNSYTWNMQERLKRKLTMVGTVSLNFPLH
ncbi:hypothetical protein D5F01_LYC16203 [Larimichthys crocea]|uniref:PiggyBac transposable element-derived protein domain-containing protein n=1 Tax=Larimichthys crocea TaxID=215358 RepID=A0A6G0HZV0_LARCR|nr:hypothetical protein D5F01_LYC16203 [Larimichthys crocea]